MGASGRLAALEILGRGALTMAKTLDAIVIGGGSNGLVAATTFGKAGRRVLVLESRRRDRRHVARHRVRAGIPRVAAWARRRLAAAGGRARHRHGHRRSRRHRAGDRRHGRADDGELARAPVRPLAQAAERIRRLSPRDAERWPAFVARLRALAGFLEALYQLPPPDLDADSSFGELAPLLGLGRKFRSFGRADMTELLRVLPMSVQDLADDWFENESLKAAIARRRRARHPAGAALGRNVVRAAAPPRRRAAGLGARARLVARRPRRVHRDGRGARAKGGRRDPHRRRRSSGSS